MISNADKLKALRYTLGLSQAQMADKIGVSESSVAHCEEGVTPLGKVKTPAQSKIKAFLEVQDISPLAIAESKKVFGLEERQKAIQKHFTEGKCYRIYSGGSQKASLANKSWDRECVFMFLRKEGIHHISREVLGGWERTYTDAQLIGKNIEEVQP